MDLAESDGCCAPGYTKATVHSVLPKAPQHHHAQPPAWWPGLDHSDRRKHLLHWGQAGTQLGWETEEGIVGVRQLRGLGEGQTSAEVAGRRGGGGGCSVGTTGAQAKAEMEDKSGES